MINQSSEINLSPLNQMQRIAARKRAIDAVIALAGAPPQREDFDDMALSEYPPSFGRRVRQALLVALIAAGSISFFRMFNIGRDHFLEDINDKYQAAWVGVSNFVLSELLVIISIVAMEVYKIKGWKRFALGITTLGGLVMAFVGNWAFVQPDTLFGYVETALPPLAVLSLALVLEAEIMQSAKQRREANRAFEAAYAEYKATIATPEQHAEFTRLYVNELRDEIYKQNKGRKARREYMDNLTDLEWIPYVRDAMRADHWYSLAVQDEQAEQVQTETVHSQAYSANEHANGASRERDDEQRSFIHEPEPPRAGTNGHTERAATGYRKTMNARDIVRDYFAVPQHAGHIEHSLDALVEEIGAWAGADIGRTTIHNVRKDMEKEFAEAI